MATLADALIFIHYCGTREGNRLQALAAEYPSDVGTANPFRALLDLDESESFLAFAADLAFHFDSAGGLRSKQFLDTARAIAARHRDTLPVDRNKNDAQTFYEVAE